MIHFLTLVFVVTLHLLPKEKERGPQALGEARETR